VTIAIRPSSGGGMCASFMISDYRKQEYFCTKGWTGQISLKSFKKNHRLAQRILPRGSAGERGPTGEIQLIFRPTGKAALTSRSRSHASLLPDQLRKFLAPEELRPAERGGVVFVVANVRIGPGIKQETGDVDRSVLDGHVKGGVIAVPHETLGVDG